MKHTKKSGFTLVELAIVLVIIGLIIGGVLVGQDLIKAAEIRNSASQIEKYNTAATAFRTKYDGYPGDLIKSRAANFSLTNLGTGLDGLEDGDGVLENGGTPADKQGVGGEATLFWVHLTEAQFISDGFVGGLTTLGRNGEVAIAVAAANLPATLPSLKIRDNAFIHATGINGRNYFYVSNPTAIAASTGVMTEAATSGALTPLEAENIDSKVDDGIYSTGILRAYTTLPLAVAETQDPGAAPGSGICVNFGAGAPIIGDESYNLNPQFSSSVACRVRWRASF